ncbi:hypothetical protein [Flagellimonas algicola]|uniref:Lipoprotein n=1 Tax=Flagellimonas algicola TaxID=2583815 RepID=A0ABY2WPR3_9FLAO|nr:hypothetical protein [Allomuricauda algicola]TMU56666.1 hypothetical protein FGG15_03745 [Allomuricauda algicola]
MINSRIRSFTLLGIFTIFLTSCGNHNLSKKTQTPPHFEHGRELIAHLDYNVSLLNDLDANHTGFNEKAVLINEQIRKTIERIQSKKLLKEVCKSYSILEHDFLFTISRDEKIGVFSWESRMQGAFQGIRNIALYTNNGKIIPTSLYGDSMIYQQIHTIKTGTKNFYLLQGQGVTNINEEFFRIDSYTINENGMELAKIFPNRQSSIVSQLDFNVEMDGSLILKPETWGTTLAYRPLELQADHKSVNYIEASTTIGHKINSKAFEIKSSDNFLQGSEAAKTFEGTNSRTFLFEDELEVQMNYNEEEDKSLTLIGNGDFKIHWEGKTSLVAKKDGFLFFSEKLDTNKEMLHLYDIDSKSFKWTSPLTKAFILDDSILFAEKTESYLVSNAHEVSCGSSVGINRAYFKVYSVRFREKHPIVEFTNQIFCSSIANNQLAKL